LRNAASIRRPCRHQEQRRSTAGRAHRIIDALSSANVMTFADKAYQGASDSIRTPFKRQRYRPKLSRWQKKVNRAHARIRARGERANATLKTWKGQIQAVEAFASTSSANISEGFFQLWILRGRSLISGN
jgi:hypothetical protein